MSVITITFGEGAENSRGMQKLGTLASKGYSRQDLMVFQSNFEKAGFKCELVNLNQQFPVDSDDACVLVVRKGVNAILRPDYSGADLFQELLKLNWDTKFLSYGKVMNKRARYNLCFSEQPQEPDYEAGKGRIVPWKDVPILTQARKQLQVFVEGGSQLLAEGNYYYDVNKCGVKFHGDDQRKKVIGLRLAHGKCPPIHYQWFIYGKPIGQRVIIELNDQDLYIMSEKASGNDAHLKNKPILKHATGSSKFTEID